ncbi:rhamnogalacturonan lyase [Pelobium manganitolerans]|uniref:rhamnogalacturonan lyase n=1 Tax=Pelobium manganitolerans TaxID=1842495 RepID=UPI001FE49D42|nr:rhamnogalacturonan lyase [Pelobium manganitolerans]
MCFANQLFAQRQMEFLDRGLIAIPAQNSGVYLSWRLLATDANDISFNIYRVNLKGAATKLNKLPIKLTTDFVDSEGTAESDYKLTAFIDKKEVELATAHAQKEAYLKIPLQVPAGGTIEGSTYSYSPNDASVGDLDGDGKYEIILKWEPSNAKNPPQKGFTANQLLDAYTLDGQFLWRIDLGKNIRSGAAYTQFLVYDFDGDGKAELICKTADGTKDGLGNVIGDAKKDWRNYDKSSPFYGKISEGPEYISVFSGLTGEVLATETYTPSRYPLNGWGGIGGNGGNDSNASRADRFTACVAYLDGLKPSAVMVRGWYGRSVLSAWDFDGKNLKQRWIFDSENAENSYSGMGNHSLSVADVDGDGKDEICIGAMTVDDNGKGLYTTGLRHGDAMHLTDLDPSRPGLEVYGIHESEGKTLALNTPGVAMFDAKSGEIIWSKFPATDVGRGVAADIDPRYTGFENWGGPGGLRDVKGNSISEKAPRSTNFLVWWDADLTRELLDKNYIEKWDWQKEETKRLLTAEGCLANNGTKATPCLSADIFGDWREEVIWRSADNKELRIYSSNIPANNRITTLMHNPQYRLAIAWQNVAYNQPPHTGFYLGAETKTYPKPQIKLVKR